MRIIVLALIMCVAVILPATADILAQYNMDELVYNADTGKYEVVDITGNGHNGFFNSSVDPAKLDQTDPFNLIDSFSLERRGGNPKPYADVYLTNPGSMDFNNGGQSQYTLEAWFKPTVIQASTLIQITFPSSGSISLGMLADGSPVTKFYMGSGWRDAIGTTPLEADTWTHIAAIYNKDWGSGKDAVLRLYVNGQEVSNVYVGQAIHSTTNNAFMTGGGNFGNMNGFIDDVRIANHALDLAELGYYGSFSVPEPSSLMFLGFGGLAALAGLRRRVGK